MRICFNCLSDAYDCKCSVAIPHNAVDLLAVVSVLFPVYTHLLFAYLVSSYSNECFINSTFLY